MHGNKFAPSSDHDRRPKYHILHSTFYYRLLSFPFSNMVPAPGIFPSSKGADVYKALHACFFTCFDKSPGPVRMDNLERGSFSLKDYTDEMYNGFNSFQCFFQ